MGTNYYATRNVCAHCGRGDEREHIGKSSAGWCFSLHVDPERNIATLDDWKRAWQGAALTNEYGETLTEAEVLKVITERSWRAPDPSKPPCGYTSLEDMLRQNDAQLGPNGLLRHRLGRYCIGHGEGTWDYIVGEFS